MVCDLQLSQILSHLFLWILSSVPPHTESSYHVHVLGWEGYLRLIESVQRLVFQSYVSCELENQGVLSVLSEVVGAMLQMDVMKHELGLDETTRDY